MIRKIIRLSIVAVLVLSIAICFAGCFEKPEPEISVEPAEEASVSSDNGFTEATIAKVVDGDTVKVMLDGQKITIRIIGINTPESVAEDESRNTEEGRKALKEELSPDFNLKIGIEQGLMPSTCEAMSDFSSRYPCLDFIICSTHVVDGFDPYYPAYFEKWGEKDYEVFYCQIMQPSQVTVLATKSGEVK